MADRAAPTTEPGIAGHLREIVRHGGVFGIGLVLTRLTSIVLLPFYTGVLTPADYGVIAVLDIVQELLRLAIGTAWTNAVARFHFDRDEPQAQSRVWWTALVALVLLGTAAIAPLFLVTGRLSELTIGGVAGGGVLYGLMLASLWFSLPEALLQNHLRVVKRSNLYVGLSLGRFLVNATLNVSLLYYWQLGVVGVLVGNLITGAVWCGVQLAIFRRLRGGVRFEWNLIGPMTRFGLPLMTVALLAAAMHQINRYFLVAFVSLHDIGIYSFAYQFGQGVNSLMLSPFSQIWSVVVYEIAALDEPKRIFSEIFVVFTRVLLLVLLAASLAARAAVALLAPPEYAAAADLIPIICLAYFFFSLDDHFRVPALIHKRTVTLIPVYLTTVVLTALLNLWLVPRWGSVGAAWATLVTFIGFALAGLHWYRRVDRIEYPIARTAGAVGLVAAVYVGYHLTTGDQTAIVRTLVGMVLWAAVAAVFLAGPLRAWRDSRRAPALVDAR
jgi:O-antigen/teichoic acid export membrane protein